MLLAFPLEQLLEKHFLIQGATGQRKTLYLVSLLLQFFAFGHAIVVIDLGGDRPALHLLRAACEKSKALGKHFHFFSIDNRHKSLYFDPLVTGSGFKSFIIGANAIASGLQLVHSDGYGRTFWSRFNLADLNEAFDRLREHRITNPTFADIVRELKRIAKERRRSDQVSESVLAAEQLCRIEHFGVAPTPKQQLSIADVISTGGIAYFWLPVAQFKAEARAIATLAAWCVMLELAERAEQNLAPCVTHLAIDEYAQIAAGKNSVESQLTLSRKWGLQMWPVFQSFEQMSTPDGNLWPVLRDNCQARFHFNLESEEDQRQLMYASEDELKTISTPSTPDIVPTSTVRQFLAPKLERNKILEISGKAMWTFGVFKLGDQHRDPIPFEIIPPTKSVEHHAELKLTEIPRKPNPTSDTTAATNDTSERTLQQALAELYATRMAAVGRSGGHGRVQGIGDEPGGNER